MFSKWFSWWEKFRTFKNNSKVALNGCVALRQTMTWTQSYSVSSPSCPAGGPHRTWGTRKSWRPQKSLGTGVSSGALERPEQITMLDRRPRRQGTDHLVDRFAWPTWCSPTRCPKTPSLPGGPSDPAGPWEDKKTVLVYSWLYTVLLFSIDHNVHYPKYSYHVWLQPNKSPQMYLYYFILLSYLFNAFYPKQLKVNSDTSN